MASSKNLCIFIGNLGADPDVRYLPSGDAVASFSIAVTEKWKDKASGEMKESTEWIRISAFGRLGEVCGEYLKKGSKVYVEGKFKTRKWTDQAGVERYSTEIKCEEMIMLDGSNRSEGGGNGGGYSRSNEGDQRRGNNGSNRSQGGNGGGQRQPQNRAPAGGGFDEMDDDIPFAPPYRGMQWLSVV